MSACSNGLEAAVVGKYGGEVQCRLALFLDIFEMANVALLRC